MLASTPLRLMDPGNPEPQLDQDFMSTLDPIELKCYVARQILYANGKGRTLSSSRWAPGSTGNHAALRPNRAVKIVDPATLKSHPAAVPIASALPSVVPVADALPVVVPMASTTPAATGATIPVASQGFIQIAPTFNRNAYGAPRVTKKVPAAPRAASLKTGSLKSPSRLDGSQLKAAKVSDKSQPISIIPVPVIPTPTLEVASPSVLEHAGTEKKMSRALDLEALPSESVSTVPDEEMEEVVEWVEKPSKRSGCSIWIEKRRVISKPKTLEHTVTEKVAVALDLDLQIPSSKSESTVPIEEEMVEETEWVQKSSKRPGCFKWIEKRRMVSKPKTVDLAKTLATPQVATVVSIPQPNTVTSQSNFTTSSTKQTSEKSIEVTVPAPPQLVTVAKMPQANNVTSHPDLTTANAHQTSEKPIDFMAQPATPDQAPLEEQILNELKATEELLGEDSGLTDAAIYKVAGGFEHKSDDDDVDSYGNVSDAGVPPTKKNIRATQGRTAAEDLLDYDGKTWMPPPCDWSERARYDDALVPLYIKEWREDLPHGPKSTLDITQQGFKDGTLAVCNTTLIDGQIPQPTCIPDTSDPEYESKRLKQTSEYDSMMFVTQANDRQKIQRINKRLLGKHQHKMFHEAPEPHEFTPKIPMYIRPVMDKDLVGVHQIYNHYVQHSPIPEDQELITEDTMREMIRISRADKFPFLVAIKGKVPEAVDAQGRYGVKTHLVPQTEEVIGFSFSDTFNYGFAGKANGRSRYTANMHLYVKTGHLRLGIGRNLLDRMINAMDGSSCQNNVADFINPENVEHCNRGGGHVRPRWHQLIFQVPVEPDGIYLEATTHFMERLNFNKTALLKSVVRTKPRPNLDAKWYDLAIYQHEAGWLIDFKGDA